MLGVFGIATSVQKLDRCDLTLIPLLADVCVFQVEEKRSYTGKHPKDELKHEDETRWVYDLVPYILGW